MMPRYIVFAVIKIVFVIIAFIVNPILPLFNVTTLGWTNNREKLGVEEFLPRWLKWLSTNYDNSLWGDEAHQLRHPNFKGYWAKVCWLYRNPCKGIDWSLLGAPTSPTQVFKVNDNYFIAEGGYFQIIKGGYVFGWLLDAYYNRNNDEPRASFVLGR